jgi:anti-sigma B factor antagonist
VKVEIVRTHAVTVVIAEGILDTDTARTLWRTLTDLIGAGETKLVIDLSGVACVDSSGLGSLVAAMKRARAAGGDLRLCGLQDNVRSIFEMTRLIKQIAVYEDRDEAISSWE